MVNGILVRVRTGVPWPDLPGHYGCWKSFYGLLVAGRWTVPGSGSCRRSKPKPIWPGGSTGRWWRRIDVLSGAGPESCRGQVPKKGTTPRHNRPDEATGRPDHVSGDMACSSRRNRHYLRRRRIRHAIPNRRASGPTATAEAARRQARWLRARPLPKTQRGRADRRPAQELPERSRPATKSARTSSTAPSPRQQSAYGSAHDPLDSALAPD